MKSIFLKLILSGTFCLFFIQCSKAQVIYTDVVPNSIIDSTNSVYLLDLNNDSVTDYNINFTAGTISGSCQGTHTSTAYYIKITPLDSNEVGTNATFPFYPKALLLDTLIDSAAFTWKNTASQLLAEKLWHCVGLLGIPRWMPYYVGNWNNASNKYLPLRLHMGSQVYYGWVRLSIETGVTNATIFDYAYNSSPGQPIFAGEPLPRVTQGTVTGACSDFSLVIPIYAPPGYYNPGNKFIAQLSDSTGSFNNPIILDSISTTTSDTISTTLPSVPVSGNAYKIRILSTDPAITGPASDSLTLIAPPPPASIVRTFPTGLDSVCASHDTLYLVANSVYGLTYHWYFNGILQSSSTDSIFNLTSGSGIYSVSESNICGSDSMSAPFTLFVSPVGPVTLDPFLQPVCWTDPPFALTGGHPAGGYYTGFLAVDSVTGMFNPALAFAGNNYVYYTVPDSILPQCDNTAMRAIVITNCGTSVNEIGSNRASFYSRGKMIGVQLSDNYLTEGKILIYDNAGRKLKQKNITGEKNEIDMSECSSGIYFVRIQTTMHTVIGRVFIE
jgi:hypothetical protein